MYIYIYTYIYIHYSLVLKRIQSYYRLPYIVWTINLTITRAKGIIRTEELPTSEVFQLKICRKRTFEKPRRRWKNKNQNRLIYIGAGFINLTMDSKNVYEFCRNGKELVDSIHDKHFLTTLVTVNFTVRLILPHGVKYLVTSKGSQTVQTICI